MADPTETPDATVPATATNIAISPIAVGAQPEDPKGGKDAILADLAKERDKRQALEQTVNELKSAQQQQMDALAKALGLKGNEPPDPAKLAAQLTAEQARAREAAVQVAVYRNATANGANPDALLDSASFLKSVADIDPTDSKALAMAIKSAVEANPRLAADDGRPRVPRPDPTQGRPAGGAAMNPRAADLAQIEADLAAIRR